MTRIVTDLDKDAVISALREFVPTSHDARLFRSTFEGEVDPQRLLVAYRFGWFAPPIRLATFRGRVLDASHGTTIEGEVTSNWIIHVFTWWIIAVVPLSLIGYVYYRDYSNLFWGLVTAAAVFFGGRAFIRVTHQYIVDELCRATRGKVSNE